MNRAHGLAPGGRPDASPRADTGTSRPSGILAVASALVLLAAWTPAASGVSPAPARAGAATSQPVGSSRSPRAPRVRARSALLVERDTGEVIFQHAASARRPIASTTKLMTALLTLEHARLSERVAAVDYHALPAESTMGLRPGERLSVGDLLRGLLLTSANDAAATLAKRVEGSVSRFVAEMNRRAVALGLKGTHYANPVGLDAPGNYSTAADLARLTGVLLRQPFFARTVAMAHATLTTGSRTRTVANRNSLIGRYRFVDGVKTGHTIGAGYVLIGAARRRGIRVISVVLGDPSEPDRDTDSLALLRYGLARYRVAHPIRRGEVLARTPLRHRSSVRVDLLAAHSLPVVVGPRDRPAVAVSGVPAQLDGPLSAGAPVGTALVRLRGHIVGRVALLAARAVPRVTLGARLRDYVLRPLTLVALATLIGCSLQLVRLRRRASRHRRRIDRETSTESA